MAFTQTEQMLLTYTPERAGKRVPSAGYRPTWTGLTDSLETGMRSLRYEDGPHRIWHEVEAYVDFFITANFYGVFFNDVLA